MRSTLLIAFCVLLQATMSVHLCLATQDISKEVNNIIAGLNSKKIPTDSLGDRYAQLSESDQRSLMMQFVLYLTGKTNLFENGTVNSGIKYTVQYALFSIAYSNRASASLDQEFEPIFSMLRNKQATESLKHIELILDVVPKLVPSEKTFQEMVRFCDDHSNDTLSSFATKGLLDSFAFGKMIYNAKSDNDPHIEKLKQIFLAKDTFDITRANTSGILVLSQLPSAAKVGIQGFAIQPTEKMGAQGEMEKSTYELLKVSAGLQKVFEGSKSKLSYLMPELLLLMKSGKVDKEALPFLYSAMFSISPEVAHAAITANILENSTPSKVIKTVGSIFSNEKYYMDDIRKSDPLRFKQIALKLISNGDTGTVNYALDLLGTTNSDDELVHAAIDSILRTTSSDEPKPSLLPPLQNTEYFELLEARSKKFISIFNKKGRSGEKFLPQLLRAVEDPKLPQLEKMLAIAALSEIGSPNALPILYNSLKAKTESDLEYIRELAGVIGSITSHLDDKERRSAEERAIAFLGDQNPVLDFERRMLRKSISNPSKEKISDAEVEKRLVGSKISKNLCELLCKLEEKIAIWGADKLLLTPDKYFDPEKPKFVWELATKALGAIFISRATPYCSKATNDLKSIVTNWFAQPIQKENVSSKKTENAVSFQTFQDLDLSPEVKNRLKEFLDRTKDFSTKEGLPHNSTGVYAKTFYSLFLRLLSRQSISKDLVKNLDQTLALDIIGPESKSSEANVKNSLMTTHLFTSVLLAMTSPAPESVEALNKVVSEAKKRNLGPCAMPYYPFFRGPIWEETATQREGAPRAVMVHLALLLKDPNKENRNKHIEDLALCIENYNNNFIDYFDLVGKDYFNGPLGMGYLHDPNDDHLAPYFGPSTLPYVASAIQLLLTDKSIDEKTKGKILKEKERLRHRARLLFDENGLVKQQSIEIYSSALAYDVPQIGLALTSILDPEKDKCDEHVANPSIGILDSNIGLINHTSPENHSHKSENHKR